MTAPVGWSNIALEWQLPGLREWYQRLATQKMLVRFDYRNEGMSDRGVGDASLEAYGVDFDALVTHLALQRFDLVGFFGAVRPAIAWAAVHADAVCHLVLWSALAHNRDTFFRGDEARSKERDDAMLSLAERDWELATETYAHTVLGWGTGQPIEEDGDLFGATVILASRIAAQAEGGEILVADTVRGLCSGKGFLFADRGEFVAKGFEEPVRVYEVRWRDG